MSLINIQESVSNASQEFTNWFNGYVNKINTGLSEDHIELITDTASEDKKKFYNWLKSGQEVDAASYARRQLAIPIIQNLLLDYVMEVIKYRDKLLKFAVELSDSKILTWIEINNDDEETEDSLIMAEATVNANYYKYGFNISSLIVERADNLNPPSHYQPIIFPALN